MNRLAVFVEGYTELAFVEKLVEQIAGDKASIQSVKIRGGATVKRTIATITATKPNTGQKYYVLLVDCGNDDLVKSRILEEHERLTKQGYSKILGLRDVRPQFKHADIPRLERYLPMYVKTSLAPVEFILSIMEIEAWFLSEHTHFPRIDPSITSDAIKSKLGFDPRVDDMQQRLEPTGDLQQCYAIGGKTYTKQDSKITIDSLDYAHIYLALTSKLKYLAKLIANIESFLSLDAA